ncbi:MAG: DsrE family protein [gamma proteobacterium symbiont of Bathyaustriella thionipta]|nr:DsrE family protein [gamma proteobacterium symbiont of Bathyaustriella thionipta]MCU7948963.1 DsrE family protein [gamma proteobacterium symbiont of Bathyaustriella thionipta]MCU7953965.1 DsrE family protein [gamma proteobacterium symbiont of Bathyaustriella thionipta]MCU7955508.1 DsrE family protein [gamma proteobacterium symbiont of Bathyaustriella thionipta]MCU7967097.1 DsrE family protein [gamma proteobacterium symbiont of Bathyaustriella thionipta]
MKIKQSILNFIKTVSGKNTTNESRRMALSKLLATGGAVALGASASTASAHKVETTEEKEERFPGDPPEHFIVYQLNESDHEYHQHVLGSVGAMIGKYEDNIDIVVACFGRGIHVLAKEPGRPVHDSIKEKVQSLAGQGVKFHACGRTLKSMKWTEDDLHPFAKRVDVGVADIMELQEQNYVYFSW